MKLQNIVTERVHLMTPNMNFGIVVKMNKKYDQNQIYECLMELTDAHPFLKCILGYDLEENQYFYDYCDYPMVEFTFKQDMIYTIQDSKIMDEYQYYNQRVWDLFHEGMLKITGWNSDQGMILLFVFHHLLADGKAAMQLVQEFSDLYVLEVHPALAVEHIITSTNDFKQVVELPKLTQLYINHLNRKWKKERRFISYEKYSEFAKEYIKNHSITHSIEFIKPEEFSSIKEICKKEEISVNDYLISKMMIEEKTDTIIITKDIRDELNHVEKNALGNYATAFSIQCSYHNKDIISLAKEVHSLVLEKKDPYLILLCDLALHPGLIDASCISVLGNYPSKSAKKVGSKIYRYDHSDGYSITNLGKIDSKSIIAGMFIPPASPAIQKTIGIVTINDQMFLVSSEY